VTSNMEVITAQEELGRARP